MSQYELTIVHTGDGLEAPFGHSDRLGFWKMRGNAGNVIAEQQDSQLKFSEFVFDAFLEDLQALRFLVKLNTIGGEKSHLDEMTTYALREGYSYQILLSTEPHPDDLRAWTRESLFERDQEGQRAVEKE